MTYTRIRWLQAVVAVAVTSSILSIAAIAPGRADTTFVATAAASAWLQGWPMVGHDPRRTNRSPGRGPAHPHLIFKTTLLGGSVVIGADGSIYGWGRGGLRALDAQGHSRWVAPIINLEGGPPALAPHGLLLVNGLTLSGAGASRRAGMAVLALNTVTGARRWAVHALPWAAAINGTFYVQDRPLVMGRSVPLSKGVAPLVTPDGTLYMPFVGPGSPNAGVEVITPRGQPLRRLAPNAEPSSIAWAPDGTLYEVGLRGLIALAPGGAQRWPRSPDVPLDNLGALLVGANGTIYAGDGTAVVAYAPSGRRLWQHETGATVAALAERADGVVLVVNTAELLALSHQGTALWQRALSRPAATPMVAASIAVDAAGRAYVGSADGLVRAIAPDGTLLWTLRAGKPTPVGDSPLIALGPQGMLVVAGTDGQLRVYR